MRVLALAAALVVLAAVPASAHEEIQPATITIASPHFMTLIAANEEDADLTAVTLTTPEGVSFGHGTRSPAGWTASLSGTTVEWTGGAVAHGTYEEFGFDIEPVDQPGPLSFTVALGFADGTSEDVEVVVQAIVDATVPTTTAPPTTEASTTTTGAASTTATTESATPVADEGDDDGDDALTFVALGVAGVALVLSLAGLVRSRRRGGPSPSPAGPGQDW